MPKNPNPDESLFQSLIDGNEALMRLHCQNKDAGYVMSLKNLIALTYEQLKTIKNEYAEKHCKMTEELSELSANIEKVYLEMMKVEQKFMIAEEILKERQLKGVRIDI